VKRPSRHEPPLVQRDPAGKSINNPNKIKINQHVIPEKHLLEWSVDGKLVMVTEVDTGETRTLPASNPYFCVMRLWDQWTESVMLKSNEDNFQKQISLIKCGGAFSDVQHVTAYYILLCIRIWVANKERPHYPSMVTDVSYESNKSELEDNELEMTKARSGAHFVKSTTDNKSQHMAREVVKMVMNQKFIHWCKKFEETKWVVFDSDNENFLLSDAIYNNFTNGFHILPINPRQALIADSTYNALSASGSLSVSYINSLMLKNSVNYYVMANKAFQGIASQLRCPPVPELGC
jgi:hypothetical protein